MAFASQTQAWSKSTTKYIIKQKKRASQFFRTAARLLDYNQITISWTRTLRNIKPWLLEYNKISISLWNVQLKRPADNFSRIAYAHPWLLLSQLLSNWWYTYQWKSVPQFYLTTCKVWFSIAFLTQSPSPTQIKYKANLTKQNGPFRIEQALIRY